MLLEAITAKLIEFRDDIIKLSERLLKTEQALQAEALERNSLLIALQSFESVKTDAQKTVEELVIGAESKIQLAIEAIPVPKDGEDADPVDYDAIYERVDGKINTALSDFEALANSEFKGIKSDLKTDLVKSIDGVARTLEERISKIPPAKNGKDGVVDYSLVDTKIKQAIGEIKQPDSPVVVSDISLKNRDMTVFYTNGSKKTIKLPIYSMGGGGVSESRVIQLIGESGGGTGGDVTYDRTTPMAIAVGGAAIGTTFSGTVQDALDKILYPYQAPTFSSFYIDGVATTYEVGDTFAGGDVTFRWTTTNSANVKPNSINCNGVTGLADTGSNAQNIASVTKTTATVQVYTISALSTVDASFSRNFNLVWSLKRYWGVSALTELTDDDIKAMSSEFATNRIKSVTYDCTGGRYFYFAYPTSFGDLNNTKVNGLSWNDWVLVKRDFINIFGVTIPFNIYRSFNLLNGSAVPVVWG